MLKQLIYAVAPLVFDSLGVIVFAVLLATGQGLAPATLAGLAIAAGLVAWELVRRRPVPALQWLSLVLVVLSAGATLATDDPRFVMAKPTVIYAVVGVVMLKPGWMNRYVPPEELTVVEDLMTRFGYVWAGLMFLTAAANLAVALAFTAWWTTFLAVFPAASKAALFAVQFALVRYVAIRRARTPAETPAVQAPQAGRV